MRLKQQEHVEIHRYLIRKPQAVGQMQQDLEVIQLLIQELYAGDHET